MWRTEDGIVHTVALPDPTDPFTSDALIGLRRLVAETDTEALHELIDSLLLGVSLLTAARLGTRAYRIWLTSVSRRSREGRSSLGLGGSGKWLVRRAGVGM